MTRNRRRTVWILLFMGATIFASWSWWRPYAWQVDPAARSHIEVAQVRADKSFYWLDLHVRIDERADHDLQKPVRLTTANGRTHEPANTTLSGGPDQKISDIRFKFWLESPDFEGPITLQINDGSLLVRNGTGVPALGSSHREVFTNNQW